MRKGLYRVTFFALALLLCVCTGIKLKGDNTTLPTTEAIISEPTTATAGSIPETTQAATRPAHSELYLPEYSTQQILEYFEEVVLDMEYNDGPGDISLVQKWKEPIYYRIYGEATAADLAVLHPLFAQLNEILGFPGIYAAGDAEAHNLTISFLDQESFRNAFSSRLNGEDAYGAAYFWYYTATNEIYTAEIGYRTDIDQVTRSSILVEEIINVLGISDTQLRPDSIVYQYSNDNTVPSDVDWLMVKLLYHSQIDCGMEVTACSAVIEELYY